MAYYVLYAHLEKQLVKKGDELNGKQNVGIIGQSGNSTAKHLHLQVETALPTGYPEIRGFDQFADPTDPKVVIDKYGIMCQNDQTQAYWNWWEGNSQALCGGHHTGIDYSGVIDKDHESKYCYTPANAKCKVIATGSDPLNLPHWGGYGNYVIIEVLGKKEEKTEERKMKKIYTYPLAHIYELEEEPKYGDKNVAILQKEVGLWEMGSAGKLKKRDDLKGFKVGDRVNCTREFNYTHPSNGSTYQYYSFLSNSNPKRYFFRVKKR